MKIIHWVCMLKNTIKLKNQKMNVSLAELTHQEMKVTMEIITHNY